LYIAVGDNGYYPDTPAQHPDSLLGKILRIDVESGVNPYRIPSTNPFVGKAGYAPEIWAMGLRNPWRFSFDRATGDLFIGDVGDVGMEEIDFQAASSAGGENYGWPYFEGSVAQNPSANIDKQILADMT
jgi:glucose/arabinose dehydrogenase